jgi:hypothetical protein
MWLPAVSLFHAAFFLWVDCEASHRREIHGIVVYEQLLPYTILPPWGMEGCHEPRDPFLDSRYHVPASPYFLRFRATESRDFSTHCARVCHAG